MKKKRKKLKDRDCNDSFDNESLDALALQSLNPITIGTLKAHFGFPNLQDQDPVTPPWQEFDCPGGCNVFVGIELPLSFDKPYDEVDVQERRAAEDGACELWKKMKANNEEKLKKMVELRANRQCGAQKRGSGIGSCVCNGELKEISGPEDIFYYRIRSKIFFMSVVKCGFRYKGSCQKG